MATVDYLRVIEHQMRLTTGLQFSDFKVRHWLDNCATVGQQVVFPDLSVLSHVIMRLVYFICLGATNCHLQRIVG